MARKNSINWYSIFVFVILAFNINFFYLFPDDSKIISFNVGDIDFILVFFFAFWVIIRNFRFIGTKKLSFFSFVELGAILIAISSSLTANINYHQPIWYGIRAQREMILFPFLYYSLSILLKRKKISKNQLIRTIYVFSFIEMILGLTQVLLFPNYIFIHSGGGLRYGSLRLWMNVSFPALTCCISFSNFLKKEKGISNIAYCCLCLLFIGVVTKWRMVLVAILLTLVFSFLLFWRRNIQMKIIISALFLIGLVFFFAFTSMGQDLFSLIENGGETETSGIRELGRSFYLKVISNNIMFGGGFVNILWSEAYVNSYYSLGIYWVDNGLIGYLFYYGLTGLLYIVTIYCHLFKEAGKEIKIDHDCSLLSFLIYNLLGLLTVFGLGMDGSTLILPIVLSIFSPCFSSKKIGQKEIFFRKRILIYGK